MMFRITPYEVLATQVVYPPVKIIFWNNFALWEPSFWLGCPVETLLTNQEARNESERSQRVLGKSSETTWLLVKLRKSM